MYLLRCFGNIFQSFHLLIGFWIGMNYSDYFGQDKNVISDYHLKGNAMKKVKNRVLGSWAGLCGACDIVFSIINSKIFS